METPTGFLKTSDGEGIGGIAAQFTNELVEDADLLGERLVAVRGLHSSVGVFLRTYLNPINEGQQYITVEMIDMSILLTQLKELLKVLALFFSRILRAETLNKGLQPAGFRFEVSQHLRHTGIIDAALSIVEVQFLDDFVDSTQPCFCLLTLQLLRLQGRHTVLLRNDGLRHGFYFLPTHGQQLVQILTNYLHEVLIADPGSCTRISDTLALAGTVQVPVLFALAFIDGATGTQGIPAQSALCNSLENAVSNLLFTNLQFETAQNLGLSQIVITASQIVGGAVGNIICINNIVAACATVGISGKEGRIIRINVVPTLIYTIVVTVFFAVALLGT